MNLLITLSIGRLSGGVVDEKVGGWRRWKRRVDEGGVGWVGMKLGGWGWSWMGEVELDG